MFDKVEDAVARVAQLEQALSPILHLVPQLAVVAPIADEIASTLANLGRGRVRTS